MQPALVLGIVLALALLGGLARAVRGDRRSAARMRSFLENTQAQAEASQRASGSLTVNGHSYPLHEDFDAFSHDAVAGVTALLKTTIAGLSMNDQSRLFAVMADVFGDKSPEARAVAEAGFRCLTCSKSYSVGVLLIRDQLRRGGTSNARDLTACRNCGGQDAVWIYQPPRR